MKYPSHFFIGSNYLKALLGLSLAFAGCVSDSTAPSPAKPNTISGTLYNANGTPARGLSVQIFPVDYNPRLGLAKSAASADTVTTDQSGNFQSHSLSQGRYNVLAQDGNGNRCYKDSVQVNNDAVSEIKDTVKAPGTLVGTVALQPGHDPRTVFLLVMGTGMFAAPDAQGRFTLANLAKGRYTVRFLTTLDDYQPLDTTFTVVSGRTDTVGTINLPFTGIPVPSGFVLRYDTLMRIASLTWNRADTALVSGYNVYRRQLNHGFEKINSGVVDTLFRDSLTYQDTLYQYRIRSVDKNGNEGLFSVGIDLLAVGVFEQIDSVDFTPGGPLYYDGKSLILTETASGITKIDTSGQILGQINIPSGGLNGVDSLGRVWVVGYVSSQFNQMLIFDLNGVLRDSIYEAPFINPRFIGVRNGRIYINWQAATVDSTLHEIWIYDDSLRFVSRFPNDSTPLQFQVAVGANLDLFLDNRGKLIGLHTPHLTNSTHMLVYNDSGTLVSQQTSNTIYAFKQLSTGAYLLNTYEDIFSPPLGQHLKYNILDSTFRPVAIFGNRLWHPDNLNTIEFVPGAFGKLFTTNYVNGTDIRIYRLRPQMNGRF